MAELIDHNAENRAARDRLLSLVSGLTGAQLAAPLDDGWTIGAELAHLAFWDRVHTARLRAALESSSDLPDPLAAGVIDAINDSALHAWRRIDVDVAIVLFAEASAEVDAYLATLGAATVDRIRAAGIPRHVERFRHRNEHRAAIERGTTRR